MIARIAYLSTPSPGVYVLNLQAEGEEGIQRFEISRAHLVNILIDGASLALRESTNRVPAASQPESANGRGSAVGD